MIRKYPLNSLGKKVIDHNNNYGSLDLLENWELPSLSVVVPYHNTKNTINLCLEHIFKAIRNIEAEVIVVDDGSKKFPATITINPRFLGKISLIELDDNQGRFYSRNVGLSKAKNDLVAFVDSDIIVHPRSFVEHLRIHKQRNSVTFSLFNFISLKEIDVDLSTLFLQNNDFRFYCIYQSSWIGCEEDKEFIDKTFEIIKNTDNLRNWPKNGFYGPWMLTNMVLGGLFIVDRKKALTVKGCSGVFGKYGFEETSLVTKLIAKYDSFIIPEMKYLALHIHDKESTIRKREKDILFKETHDIYFNYYLKLTLKESLNEKIQNNFS